VPAKVGVATVSDFAPMGQILVQLSGRGKVVGDSPHSGGAASSGKAEP
jgi:hypothetical protein